MPKIIFGGSKNLLRRQTPAQEAKKNLTREHQLTRHSMLRRLKHEKVDAACYEYAALIKPVPCRRAFARGLAAGKQRAHELPLHIKHLQRYLRGLG